MNPLRKLLTPSVTDRLMERDLPSPDWPVTEDGTYAVVRLELGWGEMALTPEAIERARAVHNRLAEHLLEHGWNWDALLGSYLLFRCEPFGQACSAPEAVLTARAALHALRVGPEPASPREATAAVGIATGPVVFGEWGSQSRVCSAVLGPTVDRALSLAQEARPGEIALDETTYRALGDPNRYPWEELTFTRREPSRGGFWLLSE